MSSSLIQALTSRHRNHVLHLGLQRLGIYSKSFESTYNDLQNGVQFKKAAGKFHPQFYIKKHLCFHHYLIVQSFRSSNLDSQVSKDGQENLLGFLGTLSTLGNTMFRGDKRRYIEKQFLIAFQRKIFLVYLHGNFSTKTLEII